MRCMTHEPKTLPMPPNARSPRVCRGKGPSGLRIAAERGNPLELVPGLIGGSTYVYYHYYFIILYVVQQ